MQPGMSSSGAGGEGGVSGAGLGAFGGALAGGQFDPRSFVQRPQVIARAVCLLFSIVVFGCISSQGWYWDARLQRQQCHFNQDSAACSYAAGTGVLAFLLAIGMIGGEFLFERMSNVQSRRRYVLLDLAVSALWAFLFFIAFCYLTNAWNKTERVPGITPVTNLQAAIAFSFFSVFSWAGCAYLSWNRYSAGVDAVFSSAGAGYPATYPDPDFQQQQQQQYQQPQHQQQQSGMEASPFAGGYQPSSAY